MAKKELWIQEAVGKRGSLSRQLGIPVKENIPKTLLRRIKTAKIGRTIRNPSKKGKRRYKVTRLLKKRAVLALTLKELPRHRGPRK